MFGLGSESLKFLIIQAKLKAFLFLRKNFLRFNREFGSLLLALTLKLFLCTLDDTLDPLYLTLKAFSQLVGAVDLEIGLELFISDYTVLGPYHSHS